MQFTTVFKKLKTAFGSPVQYYLGENTETLNLNELIGKKIDLVFTGKIVCIACGKTISKTYGQGYCYPCFSSLPENEECVLRPELCRAHLGIARDMEYARQHCLSPQVVYLSVTSGLKVGVTRLSQVPTRWIDQGATSAIQLALTQNRFQAGQIEVALKKHVADKTNWRAMLKGISPSFDLLIEKEKLAKSVPDESACFISDENAVTRLEYPVLWYPEKPESINLDKEKQVEAKLTGIKGQYLMFENQKVLNVRNHAGYTIRLEF